MFFIVSERKNFSFPLRTCFKDFESARLFSKVNFNIFFMLLFCLVCFLVLWFAFWFTLWFMFCFLMCLKPKFSLRRLSFVFFSVFLLVINDQGSTFFLVSSYFTTIDPLSPFRNKFAFFVILFNENVRPAVWPDRGLDRVSGLSLNLKNNPLVWRFVCLARHKYNC